MDIPLRIGNLKTVHGIYISPSLCRELIIGGDWLKTYNAVIRFKPPALMLGKEEIPLGKLETRGAKMLSEENMKIPPRRVVVSNGRLDNPNVKASLWYQVNPSSDLVGESNELTILLTVVEECLTGNVPIVTANTVL